MLNQQDDMKVEQENTGELPYKYLEYVEANNELTKPSTTSKNPVMYLNELLIKGCRTTYELVSSSGPPHETNFVMSVKINDTQVQGSGRSKKLAKAAAAQVALFKLFNVIYVPPEDGENPEEDGKTTQKRPFPFDGEENDGVKKAKKKKKKKSTDGGPSQPKGALMIFNEMKPTPKFDIEQAGSVHEPTFTAIVEMNETTFEGVGSSKKKAKTQAAEKVLTSLGLWPPQESTESATMQEEGESTTEIVDLTPNMDDDQPAPPVVATRTRATRSKVKTESTVVPGMKFELP